MARRPSTPADAAPHARNLRALLAVAGGTLILDQVSKWLVVHRLGLIDRGAIDVLPPLLNLRMAWNEGVNFGLGARFDMRWVLVALAVAISALVVAWVRRDRAGRFAHVSAGLLVGGAVGNVIDRVLYGAVADFLNFPFFGALLGRLAELLTFGRWRLDAQYSLNVADIAIFLGAVGLVLGGGAQGGARGGTRARGASARPRARKGGA